MIERVTHVLHAFVDGGIVDVGMHVPNEASGDRDKTAAGFA